MTANDTLLTPQGKDNARLITKLIVMAVGGQGGGVLTNWIEMVARNAGRAVQATSVAGVAQRTGATIYYVEIAPEGVEAPIFSLAPAAGDVDILIAAELMEAGRAIQRGFVTPDRTTLIASDHRALAVSEKMAPGNGIASSDKVIDAARDMSHKLVIADMESLAVNCGSVISASLLGGLAGSGALPFPRESYESAIKASGKGVDASLLAFSAGFSAAATPDKPVEPDVVTSVNQFQVTGPKRAKVRLEKLQHRIQSLPEQVQDMATRGLYKVVNFQNCAYGQRYLDLLEPFATSDSAEQDYELTVEAAKHIANAMAYDDVIRVADRKTRQVRTERIDLEMNKSDEQVMFVTEFFHPRAEEVAGLLPSFLGARVEASEKGMARLNRWFSKGRRIRTDGLKGFVQLYMLAGLRFYRPLTYRHKIETQHLNEWLDRVRWFQESNYRLATESLRCRRLIKGYSDTHARGLSKFDKVMNGIAQVAERTDAADWAIRLREAALQEVDGSDLDNTLEEITDLVRV